MYGVSPKPLIHIADTVAGIQRKRAGAGFAYKTATGKTVTDNATLARIRSLVIPPAWTDVWISPKANSHLQATGRDARGRKQYRYHPTFRAHRESHKHAHLAAFGAALPSIRRTVRAHMARKGLPREKVLATIVTLLETTLIRVGNADYARANHSYGLTTLRDPHVGISGSELQFHFKGKSGKVWRLKVQNARVARIVKDCRDIPGQHLFQYRDSDGRRRKIESGDVNAYLRDIAGADITAKDFRTWAGTVLAALALANFEAPESEAEAKRNIRAVIEDVAGQLGNTVAICRKCYVHPAVVDAYTAGELKLKKPARAEMSLRKEEAAVLAFLRKQPSPADSGRKVTAN